MIWYYMIRYVVIWYMGLCISPSCRYPLYIYNKEWTKTYNNILFSILALFTIGKASRYRIFLCTICTCLALYPAAPDKLAVALILLKIFLCLISKLTRATKSLKRFAVALGDVIAPAGSSQHSWRAQGVVSHAKVWGGVEINQSVVFARDDFELASNSLIKLAIQEPHLHSIVVLLLQLSSNHFKWCQFRIAGLSITIRVIAPAQHSLVGLNDLWWNK